MSAIGLKYLALFSILAIPVLGAKEVKNGIPANCAKLVPFLRFPPNAGGEMPRLLSQTGAFGDLHSLTPAESLVPYTLNVSFWSDGAEKKRWIWLPRGSGGIKSTSTGSWIFPPGTVFVKHFELPISTTENLRKRLETRFLICDATGSVYGVTYKWRADGSDADLLATNLVEFIPLKPGANGPTQSWYYPSRTDCRTCHTDLAGGVLGANTRQLNREVNSITATPQNQLLVWSEAGMFAQPFRARDLAALPKLAGVHDSHRSLEDRARSYLDVNCAQCHRPGGTVANFDARYLTPLKDQNLVNGQVLIDQGVDGARTIAPNDIWRSILFQRVNTLDPIKMPPLAHEALDRESVELLRQWITSMPGPKVLTPPVITPQGGTFNRGTVVRLASNDSQAEIHYTLDGSVPDQTDPLVRGEITLTESAVLRAKTFRKGFKKSVTSQQIFIVRD